MTRTSLSVSAAALAVAGVALLSTVARGGDAVPVVEAVKIPMPAGGTLDASVHRPAKPLGCAVVFAPGQSGGRERPVVKRTAETLAAVGFTVVRFDWSFFTAGKKTPSEDLAAEVADLDAAMAFARKQPGISKVLVAGKSLGVLTAVARLLKSPDDAAALLLLTPPLALGDGPWPGAERLRHVKAPTLLLAGDHDPLCPLAALYDLAAKCDVPPRVVVVPGDHGLAKAQGDESETTANVALCAAATGLWALRFAAP